MSPATAAAAAAAAATATEATEATTNVALCLVAIVVAPGFLLATAAELGIVVLRPRKRFFALAAAVAVSAPARAAAAFLRRLERRWLLRQGRQRWRRLLRDSPDHRLTGDDEAQFVEVFASARARAGAAAWRAASSSSADERQPGPREQYAAFVYSLGGWPSRSWWEE
jgi:hypothetical protein